MKLALVMLCVVGLMLALGMSRYGIGSTPTPTPTDVQSTILDGVSKSFR